MAEKHEKKHDEDKKKKRKKTEGYNVEPAEEPVHGPTGEKIFKV